MINKNSIRSKIPDPKVQLPGPPKLSLSGTSIKPPSIDNPNLKLPTDQVASLDPTKVAESAGSGVSFSSVASAAVGAASLTPTGIAANAALGAAGGQISACGDISSRIDGLNLNVSPLNLSGMTPDGLGINWSPNKFNPSDLFNPPALPPLPQLPDCPALTSAQERLDGIKSSFPQPKISQPPAVPRINSVNLT
jgi:hypothetical protein